MSLGCHAPAKGFAAGKERQIGKQAQRFSDRGANGGMRNSGSIGTFFPLLHKGKLKAQTGNAGVRELLCDCRQERVGHSSAGAMGEHKASAGTLWHLQKGRNAHGFVNCERQRSCV